MILTRHGAILIMLIIFCSLRSIAQSEFYQVGFELYKGTATDFSDIVYCNMETGGNPGIDNSDLPKLDQFAENISVYRDTGVNTVKRDFGIETRPLINCRDTIQLRLYKTPTTTTNFRMVVDMNLYPVTPGLTAVIQDRFLNTERPLKFGDTTNIFFTITSNANTTGFRFRVVFRRTQVTTDPFTQLPAICRGEAINLPATSSNGVKGTWTPVVNNTATTTYTYIPSEGQCATSPTMTITVNQPVSPTFTQVQPICTGGTFTLPTTSNNDITGAWSPTINNTQTTDYTFTPSHGLCATTASMTVRVTPPPNAGTLIGNQNICVAGTTTLTSNGNTGGTWTSSNAAVATVNTTTGAATGVSAGTATITYTVTGTGGCADATATRTVTVNARPTVTVNSPAACSRATVTATPGTPGTYTYVWTVPTGVSNPGNVASFTTTTAGVYSVVISNTATNCTSVSASGTVTFNTIVATPSFTNNTVCGNGGGTGACNGIASLNVTGSGSYTYEWRNSSNNVIGTNSPSINNLCAGTYTIRITNTTTNCDSVVTITIGNNVFEITPSFTSFGGPFCQGTILTQPLLPTTSLNNIIGTWFPASLSTSVAGNITYKFTPNPGQCAKDTTIIVTVNQLVTPAFDPLGPYTSGTNFTLPTTSNNGIIGSWTPAINNTETTTYTFTPDPNQCANTTQVTVAINFPTSLSDLNSGKDLIIYPNPVDKGSGTVLFELGNFQPGRYQVSVYALNGIRLNEISLQHGGGTSNYRLSMDQSWSPGMYLIRISGENNFNAQKILFIK